MVLKITNLHILRYLPTCWLYLLERYTIDNQRCTHTASKNRDVVLFPDLGATTVWQDKLPLMQVLGIRAILFDFLEHQACDEDKAKGLDIADYLLKIKPAEARLQALIKQNPAIRKLIDVFKLEIIDEPQPRFRTPKRQRGFRL